MTIRVRDATNCLFGSVHVSIRPFTGIENPSTPASNWRIVFEVSWRHVLLDEEGAVSGREKNLRRFD